MPDPETIGGALEKRQDTVYAWWNNPRGERVLVVALIPDGPPSYSQLIPVAVQPGDKMDMARNDELELYVDPPAGGADLEAWLNS